MYIYIYIYIYIHFPVYIYIYNTCGVKKNGTVRKLFFILVYICKWAAFLQKYIL